MKTRGLALAWGASCLLLASLQAMAFDSDEHREMSNTAVEVAKAYVAARPDARVSPAAVTALAAWSGKYGHVTECVDYFLYPEKMLSQAWVAGAKSASAPDPGRSKVVRPTGGIPDIDHKESAQLDDACTEHGAVFEQATHSNHAHFQQDLMVSLRVWHLMAISISRDEGNPFGALFVNAMADHYLQDFFAPGHIVTVRDRLTDVPATATHDLANQMGAIFRPRLTRYSGAILDYVCPVGANGQDCVVRPDLRPILEAAGRKLQINDVPASARRLRDGKLVLFRGDGYLDGAQQAAQRLLLLCVQVASILDVLDGDNSLQRIRFDFAADDGAPIVSIDFGDYDFDFQGESIQKALATPAPTAAEAHKEEATSALGNVSTNLTRCSFGGCNDTLYQLKTRSPILSVSDERESQASEAFPARDLYTFEASASGTSIDFNGRAGRWLTGIEIIPTLGFGVYRQGEFHGSGPTFRISAAIPETEFAIGLYSRWLNYPDSGRVVRRFSGGLRIETGFSNYLTFYLTGGYDYAPRADGALSRGVLWGGGMRIGAPLTRIYDLLRLGPH